MSARSYAARNATTLKGISSLKLDSDPLGSQFLNDLAEAFERWRSSAIKVPTADLDRGGLEVDTDELSMAGLRARQAVRTFDP